VSSLTKSEAGPDPWDLRRGDDPGANRMLPQRRIQEGAGNISGKANALESTHLVSLTQVRIGGVKMSAVIPLLKHQLQMYPHTTDAAVSEIAVEKLAWRETISGIVPVA
jgi:hypothetical protein